MQQIKFTEIKLIILVYFLLILFRHIFTQLTLHLYTILSCSQTFPYNTHPLLPLPHPTRVRVLLFSPCRTHDLPAFPHIIPYHIIAYHNHTIIHVCVFFWDRLLLLTLAGLGSMIIPPPVPKWWYLWMSHYVEHI